MGSDELTLLDTHAWVWWLADPGQLSTQARQAADRAASTGSLYVSSISVWEVAMLVQRGRLQLRIPVEEWVAHAEAVPSVKFVPVNNRIALEAVSLPGPLHPDPADRIIVATARSLGAVLVTRDARLLGYPHVRGLW